MTTHHKNGRLKCYPNSIGVDSTVETDEEKMTIVEEKNLKEKEKDIVQDIDEEWEKDS